MGRVCDELLAAPDAFDPHSDPAYFAIGAVDLLSRVGNVQARKTLLAVIRSKREDTRHHALSLAHRCPSEEMLAALMEALDDHAEAGASDDEAEGLRCRDLAALSVAKIIGRDTFELAATPAERDTQISALKSWVEKHRAEIQLR